VTKRGTFVDDRLLLGSHWR